MKNNKHFNTYLIVLVLFIALLVFLLYQTPSTLTPSLPQTLPTFTVANLIETDKPLTDQTLRGQVSLLNVWTIHCEACRIEHSVLMKIKQAYLFPIYGLNVTDGSDAVNDWLQKSGNPYVMVGLDTSGTVANALGTIGTPETFLIDQNGIILYHQVGALSLKTWEDTLLPLIKEYENSATAVAQ